MDNHGYISIENENDDENDIIYNTNKDAFIEVSKDFIASKHSFSGEDQGGEFKGELYSTSDNTDILFYFLRDNTNVEWSQVKITTQNGEQKDYIGTTHLNNADISGNLIYNKHLNSSDILTEYNHIHPGMAMPTQGDIDVITPMQNNFPKAKFHIMSKEENRTIRYDMNTPVDSYTFKKEVEVVHKINNK